METTNMMRISPHHGGHGGHGNMPQDRQQQRRQKLLALFEAVEHGHVEASKHALKMLMNFDHALSTDAQFVRLSKALDSGGMYLAQQVVRDIKAKFINAKPLTSQAEHAPNPPKPHTFDGMHFVDTQA
jgi:hypothetical protein